MSPLTLIKLAANLPPATLIGVPNPYEAVFALIEATSNAGFCAGACASERVENSHTMKIAAAIFVISILRRPADRINHQHFHRPLRAFQLEAELFLEGGENRG